MLIYIYEYSFLKEVVVLCLRKRDLFVAVLFEFTDFHGGLRYSIYMIDEIIVVVIASG